MMIQNIFGNMINSSKDLEWFMINFIRHYEELENVVVDLEKQIDEDCSVLDKEYYEEKSERLENEVLELKREKRELILQFLALYDIMLKYRNDEGDSVTVKQKRTMSRFRKLLKAELHEMDLEDEIPF